MPIRIEKAAVVLRHFVFSIFLFLGAIDQVAQLANVLIQPRSRAAIKLREISQWTDEPRQRQFFVVFAGLRFDGEQRTTFGVEDE